LTRFTRATKERKGPGVDYLRRREHAREIPLNPVPVSEATMMAWTLARREITWLRVPFHVCMRWRYDERRQRPSTSRKQQQKSRERKTIIKQEEERPGSGTICSPLALEPSPALPRVCSMAASQAVSRCSILMVNIHKYGYGVLIRNMHIV
jgi:hypothetical protein